MLTPALYGVHGLAITDDVMSWMLWLVVVYLVARWEDGRAVSRYHVTTTATADDKNKNDEMYKADMTRF